MFKLNILLLVCLIISCLVGCGNRSHDAGSGSAATRITTTSAHSDEVVRHPVTSARPCGICSGTGRRACGMCHGVGSRMGSRTITEYDDYSKQVRSRVVYEPRSCPHCGGAGRTVCFACGGSGRANY